MVDIVTIGFVLAGLVLVFAGAALSVYAVVLLGSVLGGGGGYLLAPTVAGALGLEGLVAVVVPAGIGVVAGAVLAYLVLSFAVAMISFIVGAFFGWTVFAPTFVGGEWYVELGVALGVGLVLGFLAMVLTKTVLVVVTAVVGAAFASTSLTFAEFQAAQETLSIDPLVFDVYSPIFLALVILGILSQVGLFKLGYVTKLTALLPGARSLSGDDGADDANAT